MALRSRHLLRGTALLGGLAALAVAGGLYLTQVRSAGGESPAGVEAEAAMPAAPPAVEVGVATLQPERLRVWSEFSGRLRAVEAAEIRPEVGGRIVDVLFEDGQAVEAGDLLFVVDPAPYEAAVARAEAAVASAKAAVAFAEADFRRAETLVAKRAVARRYYDERETARQVASAELQTAEAELRQARIDLDHAYVRAPIDGRTGRVEVTLGNLVQPGPGAPLLTTVVANDAVYADFEVDEQTYLRSIRGHATARAAERQIPIELALPGDEGSGGDGIPEGERAYRGHIYSFDNRIDAGSGTIRARARFDNADGRLLPGMFVTVRLADAAEQEVLAVPELALGSDQSKRFVYVVDGAGRVGYREIQLGRRVEGGRRIVLSGLEAGDRVIVEGRQHVRPDSLVAAREVSPAAAGAAQQAAAR